MSDLIQIEITDRVVTLTMNRPEKRNAITQDMYAKMADAITAYGADETQRAMVITGAEDFFTSGNDVADFAIAKYDPDLPVVRFIHALLDCPKPLIAAVNGPAVGIGVTMLTLCDLVIISQDATFSMPFVPLGVVPEAGSSILMPSVLGMAVANDMLLAGRILTADEAIRFGLASRIFAPTDLRSEAGKLAAHIAASAPNAMRLSKSLIRHDREQLRSHIETELKHFFAQLQSPEFVEVVSAKMQKRAPVFK